MKILFPESICTKAAAGARLDDQWFGMLVNAATTMTPEEFSEWIEANESITFDTMHADLKEYAYKKDGTRKARTYNVPMCDEHKVIDAGLTHKRGQTQGKTPEDVLIVTGLHPSYHTARSVVQRALDAGVDMKGRGTLMLGKTAIESVLKDMRHPASLDDGAIARIDWITKNWDALGSKVQNYVNDSLRNVL